MGFQANVLYETSYAIGIGQLDQTVSPVFHNTLRQLIMRIPAVGKKWDSQHFKPLFCSVDQMFRGTGYVFSFLPDNSGLAKSVVKGLLTYLRHCYYEVKDDLNKCFTPEAIEDANNSYWDPKRGAVAAADDQVTNLNSNDTDKEYYFDLSELATANAAAGNGVGTGQGGTGQEGDQSALSASVTTVDSVSTFHPTPKTAEEKEQAAANKLSSAEKFMHG